MKEKLEELNRVIALLQEISTEVEEAQGFLLQCEQRLLQLYDETEEEGRRQREREEDDG